MNANIDVATAAFNFKSFATALTAASLVDAFGTIGLNFKPHGTACE